MARGVRDNDDDAPKLEIGPVLIHYGASSLPGGAGWRTMRCPFPEHDDHNASGRVNLELGAYKCHACGISGDTIKIIRDREGLTYAQAVEFARSVFGASVESVSYTVSRKGKSRKFGRNKWREILD